MAILSSVVALRVDASLEVSAERSAEIRAALVRAIEARTGAAVVVDDVLWEARCGSDCEAEVRARTGAVDVVLVRALGALTLLRLVVQRSPSPVSNSQRFEIEVAAGADAKSVAVEIAATLFPTFDPTSSPSLPDADAEPLGAAPWILFGAGATAVALGAGFAISSHSLRSEAEGPNVDAPTREVLDGRARTQSLVSNLSFAIGAAAILSAILWITS